MSSHGGCPKCHYHDERVIRTAYVESADHIRRRIECRECKNRRTTYEISSEVYQALVLALRNGDIVLQ